MKLWERHDKFESIPAIRSFLYTATRNTSLNWIRQQKRNNQRTKELTYLADETEQSVMHRIIETELYREVFMTLKTLPPQCKKIFQMLFLEGKDYKQVAKELNLSVSTIHNQKARAIALLKKRIVFDWLFIILILQFI